MKWTIISPPKESETANKVQEVISFDHELFRAQNLAKKTNLNQVGYFTDTGLLPSELLHQSCFWRCYVTNECVKAFQRLRKKANVTQQKVRSY